jgi:predicted amidohydrolase YtcJ
VGRQEDILQDAETKYIHKIRMNGSLILPGLIDSHAHLILQGEKMNSVDLKGAASVDQIRQRIINHLNENPSIKSGSWIKGMGWDQTLFDPPVFPSFEDLDLDESIRDFPIVLYRIDAHALWTNGKALKLSEPFWKNYSNKNDIVFRKGKNQGIFLDDAMFTVTAAIPKLTEKEKYRILDLAINEMLKYGLTGIRDAGVLAENIEFFKRAIDGQKFPIRSYAMVFCQDQNTYCGDSVEKINYKDHLIVKSVKLVMDGALGSWGALMLDPYKDNPYSYGIQRLIANGSIPGLVKKVRIIDLWT